MVKDIAVEHSVERHENGPFSYIDAHGQEVFESDSSLIRENILINDSSCPIRILSYKFKIQYGSAWVIEAIARMNVKKPVVVVEVFTALFDVFGQHMRNLKFLRIKDYATGQSDNEMWWDELENEPDELLTTAIYVSRVRLADGTQWIADRDGIVRAFTSLNLKRVVGRDETE